MIRVIEQQQPSEKDRMMTLLNKFLSDDQGATAIEYGLIAALVSVAIIGILGTVGGNLINTFTTVSGSLAIDG